MTYYLIIRGPAGVGKSAIAKELARILNAYHISFDDVMRQKKLDVIKGEGIPAKNFIEANKIVLPDAIKKLKSGRIVVFDGCFYREEQLTHLLENLPFKYFIFSLKASIEECLSRNQTRKQPMTKEAIVAVHELVSRKDHGQVIDTNKKAVKEIVSEILNCVPKVFST